MSSDNFVGKRLEGTLKNSRAELDDSVKRVLALKPILARLLKDSFGITNARLKYIRSLMETFNLTAEKAMEALKLTQKEQRELMELL